MGKYQIGMCSDNWMNRLIHVAHTVLKICYKEASHNNVDLRQLALILQIHYQVSQIVSNSWHPSVHVHFQYCFVQNNIFVVFTSKWYGLGLCEMNTHSLRMVVTILLSLCLEQVL